MLRHNAPKNGTKPPERSDPSSAPWETERRLRPLIEHSSDIVSILDPSGIALFESPSIERVLGYAPDELLGHDVFTLIHPDDRATILNVFRTALAESGAAPSLSPPYRFRHRDGSWRWLESIGSNLCADPEVAGVVINSRDVTERLEADAALRRSEARFRTLFDSTATGIAILDGSGRVVHTNQALRDMLGYTERELSLLLFTEFTHPEDQQLDWELFGQIMRGERNSYRLEKRYIRKDGRIVWGRLTASIVRGTEGEPDMLIGMVEDATDQKRAEQRSAAFQELGRVLNTATTPGEAARIVLRVADSLLGWDACWLDLFSSDGMGHSNLILMDTIDGRKMDLPVAVGNVASSPLAERVLREGPIMVLHPRGELPAADADGMMPFGDVERASASLLCVPIRSGSRTIGALSIQSYQFDAYNQEDLMVLQALADYCAGALERTQAEGARHALEQQLVQSQRMEAMGRLAGGVAHDFNNMLAVINGYSDLLMMSTPSGTNVHSSLEQIRQAGERAARLTQQLLAFSRKQIVQLRTIRLDEAICGIDRMLRRLIGEDIELVTLSEPNLSAVRADLGQLEQVLFNLAVNARDAMPRGGKLVIHARNVLLDPEAAERVSGANSGAYVLLSVADTGCGMTGDTLERIFEPFFTTKEPGKGTGLGLATVYGIVKQNGGFIRVDSTPARGSTFRIYLPALEPHPTPADATASPQTVPAAGHETVLLVEDEPMVRTLARHILESSGYRILEAENGEQAARIADGHPGPIDLLLADVVMPQMNGRELAERIAAGHPETRILFMSGYTDDAVIRYGVNHAHTAFLQKPFTPASLTREVRRVLTSS